MNIPAHVIAHANPQAKMMIAQMQAREAGQRPQAAAVSGTACTAVPVVATEKPLRVDIVAEAHRRQAEATARATASMERTIAQTKGEKRHPWPPVMEAMNRSRNPETLATANMRKLLASR